MEISRNCCAVCLGNLLPIYVLQNMPITLSCLSELENYKYSNMSFSQCLKCHTIQLDKLIPLKLLYSKSHNYSSFGKTWAGYFDLFNKKITTIIDCKNILEIGCPSGKIANKHNNYKKWYIVEPNKNNSVSFNEKIIFIEDYFDDNFHLNDQINVIVHSHLFEHIYEPNKFLKKCHNMLSEDGEMFFGVPDMQNIAENNLCLFLGVFFEHTIFLNQQNITYLLKLNGFEIIEIDDYQKHSKLYHVKKSSTCLNNPLAITNYIENFNNYITECKLYIEKCNLFINKSTKKVYVFGASYNSQFLFSLGINIKCISGILDNCVEKQNKYLYGYNLLVYNPNIIENNDCIVILKNGYYDHEIKEQLIHLNKNVIIL